MKVSFGVVPLSCPFCGRNPEVIRAAGFGTYTVRCSNQYCAARPSVTGGSRRVATLMWNRRSNVEG